MIIVVMVIMICGLFIIMIIEYYDGNDNGEIDIAYGSGPLSCEDLPLKF